LLGVVGVQAAVTAAVEATDLANPGVVVACTAAARIADSGRRNPPMEGTVAALTSPVSAACFGVATTTAASRTTGLAVVALT
jgi:hypothetical protein